MLAMLLPFLRCITSDKGSVVNECMTFIHRLTTVFLGMCVAHIHLDLCVHKKNCGVGTSKNGVTCPDLIYVMILIIDLCRLKCLLEVSESIGLRFKPPLLLFFYFFPYFFTSSFFSTLGACALSAVVVVFFLLT